MKENLKERYQKAGNVYLGLVHRLDFPVEGIMVLAKTSKAASRLSKEIRERRFEKRYLAIVLGRPQPLEASYEDYLSKDEERNRVQRVREGTREKAKLSKLNYKVLATDGGRSLVEIDLISGRSHQIRVQFSSRSHPLLGDIRYDQAHKKSYGEDKIALLAYSLSFKHPTREESMYFHTNVSDDPVWASFADALAQYTAKNLEEA